MKRSTLLVAVLLITLQVSAADRRLVLIAGRPSHPLGMHEFRGAVFFSKSASRVIPVFKCWSIQTDGPRE